MERRRHQPIRESKPLASTVLWSLERAKREAEQQGKQPLAFLAARATTREQVADGDLDQQVAWLKKAGLEWFEDFHDGPADGKVLTDTSRPGLARARDLAAGYLGHSRWFPFVFLTDRTRVMRTATDHLRSDPNGTSDAPLSAAELQVIARFFGPVPCVLWLDPDAPRKAIRALRNKIGKGGRPRQTKPGDMKRRREILVRRLRKLLAAGWSDHCKIARELDRYAVLQKVNYGARVGESHVRYWIQNYC